MTQFTKYALVRSSISFLVGWAFADMFGLYGIIPVLAYIFYANPLYDILKKGWGDEKEAGK
jgi:hypothetical protein